MKTQARIALVVVLLLAAMAALPRPASRLVAPDASAQVPTPTIPDILPKPSPSPEPTEEDPLPDPGGGGGGEEDPSGGEGGNGGGEGGTSGGGDGDGDGGSKNNDGTGGGPGGKGKGPGLGSNGNPDVPSIAGRIPGAYDTSKLVSVAAQLRSLGMPAAEVVRKVYPPFIIAGRASWIDTWHAPRYGPAPGQVRVHEGQDVFCDYGDPILAPTDGTLSFSDGGLGGITARVHMPNGDYWYMTHLSDLNRNLAPGQPVQAGTVVGYCGNSGNASGTSPHVHFGWYQDGGVNPRNPMKALVRWLHQAERRVLGVVTKTNAKRQKQYESGALTTARRFGDTFTPDTSELRIAGESLWASGSYPASGAFALAEAALQEALSSNGLELGILPVPVDLSVPQQSVGSLDPDSVLARILEEAGHSDTEAGD